MTLQDIITKALQSVRARGGSTDPDTLTREAAKEAIRLNIKHGNPYSNADISKRMLETAPRTNELAGTVLNLPVTFGKEILNHGGGTITAARGVMSMVNALKNSPALLTAIVPDGDSTYLERVARHTEAIKKYVPDGWKPGYLEEYFPVLSNTQDLTDTQIAYTKALRDWAEDAAADAVTLGVAKGLSGVSKATTVAPAATKGIKALATKVAPYVDPAISLGLNAGTFKWSVDGYKADIAAQRQEQTQRSLDEGFKRYVTNQKKTPWYHHAAVGYGAGGVAGGATGYVLSALLNGDTATKVISTVGGGALGAVLGRILQKKFIEDGHM